MEKIILVLSLFLSGCIGTTKYVYKVPEINMPERPVLLENNVDDGQQVRNMNLNLLDLVKYSKQLENLLIEIKEKDSKEVKQ